MPGFVGHISSQKISLSLEMQNILDLDFREIKISNSLIRYYSNKKFNKEKVFKSDDEFAIGFDGLLLNSSELKSTWKASDNFELIKKIYQKIGPEGINELRGSFTGFIFNVKKSVCYVFTDHLNTKPLFVYKDAHRLVFSSSLKAVANILKQLNIRTNLSEIGAYYLLTFGFMLGNETLIQEIKKIPAATIITYPDSSDNNKIYYSLDNTKYHPKNKKDIIHNLDTLFSDAVEKEYAKDREYGYSHLSTLSGGLDSRSNVYYAWKQGYQNIQTLCFSQSGYLDELIARKIARYLGLDFIFYGLDGGKYLKNIDEVIKSNDGLIFFAGASHSLAALKALDLSKIGMIHTGQIGDLILGSYLLRQEHGPVSDDILKKAAYSLKLINKIPSHVIQNIKGKYENGELFSFYERCINGAYNGNFMAHQFTEISSPFLYLEFFNYSMNIHPKMRFQRKIYIEWIGKKMREMTKFKWEKWKERPTVLNFYLMPLIRRKHLLKNKLIKNNTEAFSSMTPLSYWYRTNPNLQRFFSGTFNKNRDVLKPYSEVSKDAEALFNEGDVFEKTQVLTLLKAVRYLLEF